MTDILFGCLSYNDLLWNCVIWVLWFNRMIVRMGDCDCVNLWVCDFVSMWLYVWLCDQVSVTRWLCSSVTVWLCDQVTVSVCDCNLCDCLWLESAHVNMRLWLRDCVCMTMWLCAQMTVWRAYDLPGHPWWSVPVPCPSVGPWTSSAAAWTHLAEPWGARIPEQTSSSPPPISSDASRPPQPVSPASPTHLQNHQNDHQQNNHLQSSSSTCLSNLSTLSTTKQSNTYPYTRRIWNFSKNSYLA